jgi:hypothetical protein
MSALPKEKCKVIDKPSSAAVSGDEKEEGDEELKPMKPPAFKDLFKFKRENKSKKCTPKPEETKSKCIDPDSDELQPMKPPSLKELFALTRDVKDKCGGVKVQMLKHTNMITVFAPILATLGPQSLVMVPMSVVLAMLATEAQRRQIKSTKAAEELAYRLATEATPETILTFDRHEVEQEEEVSDPNNLCQSCKLRQAICFILPCQHNTLCLHCGYNLVHDYAEAASDSTHFVVPCPDCSQQIVKILKLVNN